MKSHLELEQRAKETYAELADTLANPRTTSLFRGLAEDEKACHEELRLIIKTYEKTYSDLLKKIEGNEFTWAQEAKF